MTGLRADQYVSVAAVTVGMFLTGIKYQPTLPPPEFAFSFVKPAPVAVPQAQELDPPNITARSAIVIDANSHQVLLAHNPDLALPPASTTKLITALAAVSTLPLDEVVTVAPADLAAETSLRLNPGEQLTVGDALAALLVGSSNTSAKLLARSHPQGQVGFLEAMNDQVELLGLADTHFTNSTGFDQPQAVSSARDLAKAAAAVMKYPRLRSLVGSQRYQFSPVNSQRQVVMTNTNRLLADDPTVVGVKTGTTSLAGEVLVTQVERDTADLLVVVMGSRDRYGETRQLIDWAYNQHRWQPVDLASDLID